MTWTYSGNPADSNLDAVRWLVGDTSTGDQKASNEEINWAIDQNGSNVYLAAADVIDGILGSGDYTQKSVGDFSYGGGETASQLQAKAKQYRTRAARSFTPYAGGISILDNETKDDDLDIPTKAFRPGRNDIPGMTQFGDGTNNTEDTPWLDP